MTRKAKDCFDALTNNKRMTQSEIAGFQQDFNVNLNDEDGWFDAEFIDEPEMTEIDECGFVQSYVLGDDLFD